MTSRNGRGDRWRCAVVLAAAIAATTACGSAPAGTAAIPSSTPRSAATPGTGVTAESRDEGLTPADGTDHVAGVVTLDDGRGLYLECAGSGSPTVVLQSGFGNAGDIWHVALSHPPAVAEGVAAFTRVCLYDRPGSTMTSVVGPDGAVRSAESVQELQPGRSPAPATRTRTAAEVDIDLHDLLAAAGVAPPYVLVGHSLGGPFSLLYARMYPEQVAGLVLVDPTPPALRELAPPAVYEPIRSSLADPGQSLIEGYQAESYDLDASLDELAAAGPLPTVPTVLLVHDLPEPVPDPLPPGLTADVLAEVDPIVVRAQQELADSIPGATLERVPGTTHYVHTQRPDTVVDAIRQVVDQTR